MQVKHIIREKGTMSSLVKPRPIAFVLFRIKSTHYYGHSTSFLLSIKMLLLIVRENVMQII